MSDSFASPVETKTDDKNLAEPNSNDNPDQGSVKIEVGDKTYDSIDAIRKKIENADSHISQVERENAEFRDKMRDYEAKLEAAKSVEQLLSKLETKGEQPDNTLSEEKIQELVNSTLTQKQQEDLQKANWKECSDALVSHVGAKTMDEAIPVLKEKADSLGMTLEEVDQMAKTKPSLFKTVFLGGASNADQRPNSSTPKGSLNTENFNRAPETESKVVAPMSLRDTKSRTANFLAAVAEYEKNGKL